MKNGVSVKIVGLIPEIAAEVMLSKDTIKWYRKRLLVKFQAVNSAELVYKASEMKII